MQLSFPTPSKLSAHNYFTWAGQMQNYLTQRNMKKFLEHASFDAWFETLPLSDQQLRYHREHAAIDSNVKLDNQGKLDAHNRLDHLFHNDLSIWSAEKMKKRDKWTEDEQACCGTIRALVSESFWPSLKECGSPKTLWDKLKQITSVGEVGNIILLYQQLFEARPTKEESLSVYLERVISVSERLNDIGEPLKEYLVCIKVLSSLPESYNILTQSLFQSKKEELSLELLRSKFGPRRCKVTRLVRFQVNRHQGREGAIYDCSASQMQEVQQLSSQEREAESQVLLVLFHAETEVNRCEVSDRNEHQHALHHQQQRACFTHLRHRTLSCREWSLVHRLRRDGAHHEPSYRVSEHASDERHHSRPVWRDSARIFRWRRPVLRLDRSLRRCLLSIDEILLDLPRPSR
jgi:hypothetical protein